MSNWLKINQTRERISESILAKMFSRDLAHTHRRIVRSKSHTHRLTSRRQVVLSCGAVVKRDSKNVQYNTAVTVTLPLALSAQLIALAGGQQGHTGDQLSDLTRAHKIMSRIRRDGVL